MLRDGSVGVAQLTESCLARMDAVEDRVEAFLTPTPQVARERAAAVDEFITTGAASSGIAIESSADMNSSPSRARVCRQQLL